MKADASIPGPTPRRASPSRFLFVVIFVGCLAVPLFNKTAPALFGFPFFYWYQMLCVPIASLLIFIVFRAEDKGAE